VKITRLPDASPRPRSVAVGTFDGVHLGHREVIRGSDTVLTFDPHPVSVIHPEAAPKLLTDLATKADLVASLGVEELVVIPFDERFAGESPQAFIDETLVGRLGATWISVGANFRFGHRAAGDPGMLAADPRFETRVVDLVEVEGETVSSSHIRGLLLAGEVDAAARFLGAPFRMRGEVVGGDRRGRTLGYPTANLVPDDAMVCPGHGVYACRATVAGVEDVAEWPAATSVGVRPTFATGRGVLVEAHLIGFEGDLYGRELTLEFLERLRGERAFPSSEALVEQMARDVDAAGAACRAATVPGRS
jgi:riboflavin kinase / FMN adenylyltransferase